MRWRYPLALVFIAFVLICIAAGLVYSRTPLHERVSWRIANLEAQVRRVLNPPEQIVFVPQQTSKPGVIETIVESTFEAMRASITPSPATTQAIAPAVNTSTPIPSTTALHIPTPPPTAIPEKVILTGVVHEYQQFNNCGPTNLAMALSFWGWQGDQRTTRAFLRPNPEVDDKNVMPAEMVAFVETKTKLKALTRVGGDLDQLKRLIAAGFPVIIEKGHQPPDDWWMGHYVVVNGYDDTQGRFITQDSLLNPDQPVPYDELTARWWRDFNYVYLVIYPPEREAEVLALIGPDADTKENYQRASEKAVGEIPSLQYRDLFFGWFNLGSSLVGMEDFAGAAKAYDQAFALYPGLDEKDRPYRLMWYQIGPYQAYYHTQRFQDVLNLANTTLAWVGQPVLEESYYWRGMAYEALGETNRAISDFKKSATINPNYAAPREELRRLGVQVP